MLRAKGFGVLPGCAVVDEESALGIENFHPIDDMKMIASHKSRTRVRVPRSAMREFHPSARVGIASFHGTLPNKDTLF